eukprot:11248995-Alexandrium_andersonii.AAC.1
MARGPAAAPSAPFPMQEPLPSWCRRSTVSRPPAEGDAINFEERPEERKQRLRRQACDARPWRGAGDRLEAQGKRGREHP